MAKKSFTQTLTSIFQEITLINFFTILVTGFVSDWIRDCMRRWVPVSVEAQPSPFSSQQNGTLTVFSFEICQSNRYMILILFHFQGVLNVTSIIEFVKVGANGANISSTCWSTTTFAFALVFDVRNVSSALSC